jgi:RimJ/RimL family protein N-acetyltransferase
MKNICENSVRLVPLTKEHISKTYAWISNAELRASFLLRGEITWARHVDYFNSVLVDTTQQVYAILYQGEYVGNCGLKHLNIVGANAELWIYIGSPSMRGKGVGGKAIRLLLQHGMKHFGLGRMQVHVAENNKQAYQLYLSVGFVDAGEGGVEWKAHGCRILKMIWESNAV